jgi:RNA recognition motif-containing protein
LNPPRLVPAIAQEGKIMSKRLYVGNLPYDTTEGDLRDLFSPHGEVLSVSVVEDRETGRSRGFAFVEMETASADAAMSALSGTMLGDRSLTINEAKSRTETSRRSSARY